ncbi:MAG: 30S ribosomal protein S5 [Candidatus Aminicenantes bacterium]|jgi:small subunit ribosomal protein S5|nr:30S ribosomal protein S5 [Candidatus Aminicenantes bacterium]
MIVKELENIEVFEEEVISIRRVTKVVKGGKNLRFSAAVVVGDKKGNVGLGKGKAREVPLAIKKAVANAKRNLVSVPILNDTIPFYTVGKFGAARVVLRPASPGTGVIAGGSVRVIMELAGIRNILTKSLKSKNTFTVAHATMKGLVSLSTPDEIRKKRDISEEELWQ